LLKQAKVIAGEANADAQEKLAFQKIAMLL